MDMCELACAENEHVMVDGWEASQQGFIRTAQVLDHFDQEVNFEGGIQCPCKTTRIDCCNTIGCVCKKVECTRCEDGYVRVRIHLLAGGDLIQSFAIPNLWSERDVLFIYMTIMKARSYFG